MYSSAGDKRLAAGSLPQHNCGLVFSFGLNDCVLKNGVSLAVELEETAMNTRRILSEAKSWLPLLMIGPAPIDDSRLPPQTKPGTERRILNSQVAIASQAIAHVARELDIAFLDCFTMLSRNPRWHQIMGMGDGVHPTGEGYEMMAQIIRGWMPWRGLLRLTSSAAQVR